MKYTLYLFGVCIMVFSLFLGSSEVYASTPFSSSGALNAGWIDTGGGRYYDTTTGTYSNANGSVQATKSDVYGAAVQTVQTNTVNALIPNTVDQGLCTGEIRTDIAAAQDCARKAQAQAIARGYTATCSVGITQLPATDPTSGLSTIFYPDCTINGQSGHGAQYIAGWQASAGSNAIIKAISPGWSILSTELKGGTTGGTTGGSGTMGPTGTSVKTSATGATTGATGLTGMLGTGSALARSYLDQLNTAIQAINAPTDTAVQNGTTGTNSSGSCSIASNLRLGDTGAEVSTLTGILVKEGLMQGVQSTFDTTVFNAVIAYQEKYASQILTPVSLNRGTGFVGASTRSYINSHAACISTPVTVSTPSTASSGSSQQFRYLKISTTEMGWVSWREIEIYDANGAKIVPVASTGTEGAWRPAPLSDYTPDKAYDGNINTNWNAGETNPSCTSTYGPSCPFSSRSASIQLDLGSVKTVSKIVLVENGSTQSETDEVSISSDGRTFSLLTTFKAPIADFERLEWPAVIHAGDPTVSFTANGQHSIDITSATHLNYVWNATNADYVTVSYSAVKDPTIPTTAVSETSCVWIAPVPTFNPFDNKQSNVNIQDVLPLSGTRAAYNNEGCQIGYKFTLTMTATQRSTGKTSTDSFVFRVVSK